MDSTGSDHLKDEELKIRSKLEEILDQEELLSKPSVLAMVTDATTRTPSAQKLPFLDYLIFDIRLLDAAVTNEEIRHALFDMNPLKSPGLDGMNALFFKTNGTPSEPQSVLVMKIIDNRFKPVFPKTIVPNLANFIVGLNIHYALNLSLWEPMVLYCGEPPRSNVFFGRPRSKRHHPGCFSYRYCCRFGWPSSGSYVTEVAKSREVCHSRSKMAMKLNLAALSWKVPGTLQFWRQCSNLDPRVEPWLT
ncbi:hypothetical protein F3Y22_tig00111231pilonHSYRG00072 [Hibiscus syriacus]|uniref:Reverse transcriptase domain-containing protein n=1 Tax=Hibiscus syriacus TaxID=106335 RepID=A0A6A2YUA1_HIBSY|nr:hypothetical protein F3Y22_tig00111231pilonHSYRG00072 [Hibiscus syriacus]